MRVILELLTIAGAAADLEVHLPPLLQLGEAALIMRDVHIRIAPKPMMMAS